MRIKNYEEKHYSELKKLETKIIVYYADDPTSFDFVIRNGVDGILTNYPSLLAGYLRNRN